MDALFQFLQRIREQLSTMTRSQQLVILLCAVVVFGSLTWLAQWSVQPQLTPVLDQPMTAAEMSEAIAVLETLRVDYEERGDRIYVPIEDRQRLQRELATAGALPKDTSLGFENLLKETSPFLPESVNQRNLIIAIQNELADVIRQSDSVASAKVFINDKAQRRIGARGELKPTASVSVTMKRGALMDMPEVLGIASLVSGPVPGLDAHNVRVIVDGRPRMIPKPEDMAGFGLLDEKKKNEAHFRDKILEQLGYIGGVKVAVTVDLDTTRKRTTKYDYTQPEPSRERSNSTSMQSSGGASEAGVNPNTGVALTSGPSGDSSSSDESESEYFEPKLNQEEHAEQVPFTVNSVMASINIPRSYFVSVFRAQAPDKEVLPSDAELASLIDTEKLRVRAQVKSVIGATDDSAVQVDWFPDLSPDDPGSFAESPVYAAGGLSSEAGEASLLDQWPRLAVAGLASVSLMMMFMLVRRSSRTIRGLPAMPTEEDEDDGEFTSPLPSAFPGEGFLVGQEVDEETLRINNLSEQVSRLVEEDPDSSAEILRRWLEQDH